MTDRAGSASRAAAQVAQVEEHVDLVGDAHAAEQPRVARLPAALWIERGPVEHDIPAVLSGGAGAHLCIKFPQMGILIV